MCFDSDFYWWWFNFSFKAMHWKLEKINPIKGLKGFFNERTC